MIQSPAGWALLLWKQDHLIIDPIVVGSSQEKIGHSWDMMTRNKSDVAFCVAIPTSEQWTLVFLRKQTGSVMCCFVTLFCAADDFFYVYLMDHLIYD